MESENSKCHSCKKCNELDNDHMVMCDKCDQWYHFNCVGVDGNVADYSWNCDLCEQTPSTTSAPNHAVGFEALPSSSSSPLVLPLTTTMPLIVNASGFTSTEAAINTQIPNIVPSNITVTSSMPTSQQFATDSHRNMVMATAGMFRPSATTIFDTTRPTYIYTTQPISMPINFQQQRMHVSENTQKTTTSVTNTFDNSQRQKILQLERLEEERKIQQEFLERKYKILSQIDSQPIEPMNPYGFNYNHQANTTYTQIPSVGNVTSAVPAFNIHQCEPTPSQLAARRSIPRELPSFNGDPDEWPIFINSFQNSTAIAGFSNAENLMRLQSCLKGKAREVVKSKLLLPALVPDIIQTLRLCFGRPEHILERVVSKARGMPSPRDKLESIIEFALSVQNICATMESCGLESHLNNPMLVKELVDKLPNQHKLNWAMQLRDERIPIVKAFSVWLYQIAEAASKVVTPNFGKGSATVNTHMQVHSNESKFCPVCKMDSHKVHQCEDFRDLPLNQKWNIVKFNYLCRQCLNQHKGKCHQNKECGVSACKYKHHPLLHKPCNTENQPESETVSRNEIDNTQRNVQINTHDNNGEDRPFFRILPIRIHSKNSTINTFAFLDEGSSVTLVDQSIFDSLHLDGVPDPLCLQWTGGTTRAENDSVRTSFKVSGILNDTKFMVSNVYTVKHLELPSQTINMSEIAKKFPYLKNLPIQSYNNAKPMILIGADNWNLAVPIKVREGGWQQPIATKTRLGWTLQAGNKSSSTGHMLHIHACACQKRYEELHEFVKSYFNMETPTPSTLLSTDDSNAIERLKSTCKKIDGRYEVGLMWKNCDIQLPESYENAFRRLMCLHKKIVKDTSLQKNMQAQIDNLLEKGYAKKLNPAEIAIPAKKIWYLPVFITVNPNKPNKIRLVWDAAAKSNGASLNDFILSGPDLLNPLIDILLAFRVGKIAICGDIAEMFHRINVQEQDMHAQRFLWWDKDDKLHQPSTYVMRALTFGLNCAPCIAHYVRDTNANNFKLKFPRAVKSIQNHHYVDDLIDSEDTEEDAISLANQVSKIHAAAGFHIRNWASNSADVLKQLSEVPQDSQDAKQWGATEKVLVSASTSMLSKHEPMFISRSETFKFVAGDTIVLPCEVANTDPYVVAWKRGIAILTAGSVKVTPDPRVRLVNGFNLQIRDAVPQDAGDYICQIATMEPREITHTVEILVPPRIHHISTSGHLQVKKGSSVRIECSASGNPTPNVTWSRKNNILPNGEEKLHSHILSIENVDRHKGGVYICTANNGVGQPASSQVVLHVLYPPEITVERPVVFSGEGHEAMLVCIVHGETQPEVIWFKDTMQLDTTERHIMENRGSRHTLIIRKVHTQDFGNYSCVAENQLGKSRKTLQLSGKPNVAVFNSPPISQYKDRYNISWTVESHTPIEEYKLSFRRLQQGQEVDNSIDSHSSSASSSSSMLQMYGSGGIGMGGGVGGSSLSGVNLHNYRGGISSSSLNSMGNMAGGGYGSYGAGNVIHWGRNDWRDVVLPAIPTSHHYTQGMSYMIRGLDPDQHYEATVQARNRFGWSDYSQSFVFSTSSNDNEMRDLSVTFYGSKSSRLDIKSFFLVLILAVTLCVSY